MARWAVTGLAQAITIVEAESEAQAIAKAARRRLSQGCAPDPAYSWRVMDEAVGKKKAVRIGGKKRAKR